jgi:hypothetical protein
MLFFLLNVFTLVEIRLNVRKFVLKGKSAIQLRVEGLIHFFIREKIIFRSRKEGLLEANRRGLYFLGNDWLMPYWRPKPNVFIYTKFFSSAK